MTLACQAHVELADRQPWPSGGHCYAMHWVQELGNHVLRVFGRDSRDRRIRFGLCSAREAWSAGTKGVGERYGRVRSPALCGHRCCLHPFREQGAVRRSSLEPGGAAINAVKLKIPHLQDRCPNSQGLAQLA